jgi:hypothetical protein
VFVVITSVLAWYMTAAIALSKSSPTATRAVAVADSALSLRIWSKVSPSSLAASKIREDYYMKHQTSSTALK